MSLIANRDSEANESTLSIDSPQRGNVHTPRRNFRKRALELLRPRIFSSSPKSPLRSTAYLDGLRGVAAFIVYVAHSEAWNHDVEVIQLGFGYQGNYSLITLPFLRVFFTGGHAAVAVFFVISGYVLSRRPLKLIHQQSEEVYPVLSSSVFRRAIRLYFPFVTTTIVVFTLWHVLRIETEWPKPQASYLQEVFHWATEFSQFAYPFRQPSDTWFSYDFPLWTIPIEFQGSMLVFVTLLMTARISIRSRMTLNTLTAFYFLYVGGWQMFCFLMGVVLCELEILNEAGHFRLPDNSFCRLLKRHDAACLIATFSVGLYLASQPSMKDLQIASGTPGWTRLITMIPKVYIAAQWWRFWLAISAPLLVFSVGKIPWLRRLLEGPVPQYLGKVSFALYLVHIPVATTIGDRIFRITGFIRPLTPPSAWDSWISLPQIGPSGLESDFVLPQIFLLPITLYIAEIATKTIDEPSISLGSWAYSSVIEW